jgi:RNA polymerase sigma-70 factor (ECF subfamily)
MKETRTFDEPVLVKEDAEPGTATLARSSDELITLWYQEYAEAIHRKLVAAHGDEQRVEDAVSQAFFNLHVELGRGTAIRNPRAWVLTVARRLVITAWKRACREDRKHRALAWLERTPPPTPDEALCDQSREAAIRRALPALPEIERTCLRLRARGMKLADVGKIVGLRPQRVADAVARAVRRLKKKVDGEVDG